MAKLSASKQEKALELVAAWLGPQMGYDGPAPTGPDAAYRALGPELNPAWDWPASGPAPTIILEGGPYDWAIYAADTLQLEMNKLGVLAEPYSGWALCLYPL